MDVLIGVGGSELSFVALDEAIERTLEANHDLTVAVFDSEEVDTTQEGLVERVRERLAVASIEAEIRRIEGDPGPHLVQIADSEEFDRIVLGSGKRSTLGKIQLGSVAEFVLLNAETPVTLIR